MWEVGTEKKAPPEQRDGLSMFLFLLVGSGAAAYYGCLLTLCILKVLTGMPMEAC